MLDGISITPIPREMLLFLLALPADTNIVHLYTLTVLGYNLPKGRAPRSTLGCCGGLGRVDNKRVSMKAPSVSVEHETKRQPEQRRGQSEGEAALADSDPVSRGMA